VFENWFINIFTIAENRHVLPELLVSDTDRTLLTLCKVCSLVSELAVVGLRQCYPVDFFFFFLRQVLTV
jgi:hypothetical protein